MSKPNDGTPFTPAPGVSGLRFPWGYELTGTADALIATRMVDEEWLAKLPKRVVHFEAGYCGGWSERKRGGLFLVHICERDWIREPGEYDGAARASWGDCAWRPSGRRDKEILDLLRRAAIDPITASRVKGRLLEHRNSGDAKMAAFCVAALHYIAFLEKRTT